MLWPHQEKAIELSDKSFESGNTAVVIVMSTGAGKSRTGAALAHRHLAKKPDGQVLWVAHREELVAQAFDELSGWGLQCGVIQANPVRDVNPFRPVQIASTQTLLARGVYPDATMCILDEMHHYASDKWEELGLRYRRLGVPLVGLTATPIRADGRGFRGLMDDLVCPITMRELIDQGFLVDFNLIHTPRKLRNNQIATSPVEAYREHAMGRRGLVFSGNLKAAEAHRDEFLQAGIQAAMVWGEMDPVERRRTLEAYKDGRIQVLTNVGVLTEGFDDRATSCIIIARSVGSLSLWIQICGRGLRRCTGKTDCILLDLQGSVETHFPPDFAHDWSLDGADVDRKQKLVCPDTYCLGCKVLMDPGDGNVCELCAALGVVAKEATPPEVVGVKLVKYAAKLRETPDMRRNYYVKLVGEGVAKKYKPGWAKFKYKAIYGELPPPEWST